MRTIFADDSEASRMIMKRLMEIIDPEGELYPAANATEAIEMLSGHKADILFLDIEMPGFNGIEAAHYIEKNYPELNIIFVTGHPEYARDALRVYCSGFIEKPFDEDDVRDALRHLRYPVGSASPNTLRVRCKGHFAVFLNGGQFVFKRKLTNELFAYLVYKNGAMSTNGDIIGVLWDGAPDKSGFLRQLVKDMCDSFENAGITDIVVKRHGSIGLNTSAYTVEGNVDELNDEFGWC